MASSTTLTTTNTIPALAHTHSTSDHHHHHHRHHSHNNNNNNNSLIGSDDSSSRTLPFLLALWGLGAFTAGYALSRLMIYWNGITETKSTDVQRLELNRKIVSFLRSPIASQDNLPIAIALCNNVQMRALHDLYARETELKAHSSFSQLVGGPQHIAPTTTTPATPLTPTIVPQTPQSPLAGQPQQSQTTMDVMMAANNGKQTNSGGGGGGGGGGVNGPTPTPHIAKPATTITTATTATAATPLHDPIILAQLRDALNEVNYQRNCLESGFLTMSNASDIIIQVCEHYAMFVKLLNLPPLPPTPTINIYQNLSTRFEQFKVPLGSVQVQNQYYHRFQSQQQQQQQQQQYQPVVSASDIQDLVELVLLEITLGPNVVTMY